MDSSKNHPISEIYRNVQADLQRLYKDCKVLIDYPRGAEEVIVPSITVECTRIDQGKDPGNGQKTLVTYWEVRSIIPAADSDGGTLAVESRVMAAEIAERLGTERFYSKSGFMMEYLGATPDNLDRHVTNLEIWTSEFRCEIRVGRDDFSEGGPYKGDNEESYVARRVFRP